MCEETIAEQHADGVAPFCSRRRLAAAHFRAVHDVVVNERRGVNEFEHDGEIEMARTDVSGRAACEQSKRGTQPFSTTFARVSDVAFHGRIEFARLLPDAFLDAVKMRVDELQRVLDRLRCDGRFCELRYRFHWGRYKRAT